MFFFEIIYLLSIFFNDYSYSLLGGFNEHSLPLNEVCSFLGLKNLIYNLIKIITYIFFSSILIMSFVTTFSQALKTLIKS